MRAYAIVMKDNETSERGFERLVKSSEQVGNEFNITKFAAVTPENVDQVLEQENVKWNYPHTGAVKCPHTGLIKRGYGGRTPKRRWACGISHYLLWKECIFVDEPIMILEHDAEFIRKFDPISIINDMQGWYMVGLNQPWNATRLPGQYDKVLQQCTEQVCQAPKIDREEVPQGIAGASAYILKPNGAQQILEKVKQLGMWNNDAITCRQIFPWIGATKTYYTRVQTGLKSTI